MKSTFVADLAPDQAITSFFVVHEKEIRASKNGERYLRLQLGDRTGTVEARMWTGFEESAAAVTRDDFVKVQARVEMYRNRPQLVIDRLRRAQPGEVDFTDFFARTSANIEELWDRLLCHLAEVGNPWLRRLLRAVVDDPEIADRFKRAPAAKSMHHAYLGGLLEHVVSLCDLSKLVARHYPEVDGDLLMTGAVLHDLAKISELSYERAVGYTTEGELLGHIVMAVEMIGRKMDAIAGFPPPLAALVKHLILSHHGEYEFGSPKLPMFREAVLLHYLDDLDSKMAAIRQALDSERGEEHWTDRSGALERRLLRVERYVRVVESSAPAPVDAPAPEQLPLVPTGNGSAPKATAPASATESGTDAMRTNAPEREA
jgi:3'-5' exoribonuclease